MARVVLLLLLAGVAACSSFPRSADLDQLLTDLPRIQDGEARYHRVHSFLATMRDPVSVAQDEFAEVALQRLGDYFSATGDEIVLRAADETVIAGGFANIICGFYATALQSQTARTRYRGECAPLKRCEGLSLSRQELALVCDAV